MTHKRQKIHGGGSQGVQLGLIITPMLDMSFQLLAFFIMTYHPSALEAHIPGSLAPAENPPIQSVDPKPAPEVPLLSDPAILEDTLTVKVKAVVKGQEFGNHEVGAPSQIFLKLPLEVETRMVADVDV